MPKTEYSVELSRDRRLLRIYERAGDGWIYYNNNGKQLALRSNQWIVHDDEPDELVSAKCLIDGDSDSSSSEDEPHVPPPVDPRKWSDYDTMIIQQLREKLEAAGLPIPQVQKDFTPAATAMALLRKAYDDGMAQRQQKLNELDGLIADYEKLAETLLPDDYKIWARKYVEAGIEKTREHIRTLTEQRRREADQIDELVRKLRDHGAHVPEFLYGCSHELKVRKLKAAIERAETALKERQRKELAELVARLSELGYRMKDKFLSDPTVSHERKVAALKTSIEEAEKKKAEAAERDAIAAKVRAYPDTKVPEFADDVPHAERVCLLTEALHEAKQAFAVRCARLEGQIMALGGDVPEIGPDTPPRERLTALEAALDELNEEYEEDEDEEDEDEEDEDETDDEEEEPEPQPASALINPNHLDVDWDRKLGGGGFGNVFAGKYLGAPVAVKVPNVAVMRTMHKDEVEHEAGLHSRLRHARICQLFGACEKDGRLALVMEFCDGGSLNDLLQRDDGCFYAGALDVKSRVGLALEIASGMLFLHAHDVVHFDLKPDNVLLTARVPSASGSFGVKIADFGIARPVQGMSYSSSTSIRVGSPYYIAPETLARGRAGKAADVFAFGLLLFGVVTGTEHYVSLSRRVRYEEVVMRDQWRPAIPDSVPPRLARLMQRCWQHEPGARPAFEEIVHVLEDELARLDSERPQEPVPAPPPAPPDADANTNDGHAAPQRARPPGGPPGGPSLAAKILARKKDLKHVATAHRGSRKVHQRRPSELERKLAELRKD